MRFLQVSGRLATLVAMLALGRSVCASGQSLPSDPIVFADGHVTLGGAVSASFSCATGNAVYPGPCADDGGFFNYTDYNDSLLRELRLDLSAAVTAGSRLSFLTEFRTSNLNRPQPYALYMRLRPWKNRRIDIQAGRIPPTFGAFTRRAYPADNPLIGYPLAYQYLTSLRSDALPADADELLRMRGRGWLSNYSIGNPVPAPGLPLVNVLNWDTGVQIHAATDVIDAAVSVTAGTLSHPLVREDNGGKQISGRIAFQPVQGFIIGTSGARGPFVAQSAADLALEPEHDSSLTQTAWGADVEYSRGYYVIRAEAIISAWRVPDVPGISVPLRAWWTSLEGRYKIRPGLYAAARLEHLDFSDIIGSGGAREWEAPLSRVEAGIGYSIQRNLLLKLTYQYDTREGGRVPKLGMGAAQLVFWF